MGEWLPADKSFLLTTLLVSTVARDSSCGLGREETPLSTGLAHTSVMLPLSPPVKALSSFGRRVLPPRLLEDLLFWTYSKDLDLGLSNTYLLFLAVLRNLSAAVRMTLN